MFKQLLTYAIWTYSFMAIIIGGGLIYALYLVLFTSG